MTAPVSLLVHLTNKKQSYHDQNKRLRHPTTQRLLTGLY